MFVLYRIQKYEIILIIEYNSLYLHYKIVSKNDPDTKKVWCKYGKIPGQGDGVNLFFVGEINVTHYFITNIGAGLPDACAE